MIFLLVTAISLSTIVISKILLKKWTNHITIYCIIWSGLLIFYELKLIKYPDVTFTAWLYIILAFLSLLLGTLTVISARSSFPSNSFDYSQEEIHIPLFVDSGEAVKYFTIFFSVVSFLGAIQHWMILVNKFGSIPAVIVNATFVYELNAYEGGVKGMIPFVSNFAYVAIFFSALYTAYKGKFSLVTFLPFISVITKELATLGRLGILLALLEFLFAFILFRHLLSRNKLTKFKISKRNATLATILIISFMVVSASLIRVARGGMETYSGASRELNQLKDNSFISPSIYLYLSSDIGVLTKYFNSEEEKTKFGQNTFLTLYHILNKFDIVERGSDFQKGYYIPMWTNTGTYIRELHADFGITGALLGPYLLGLIMTWLWFKFYREKSIIVLTFLVYLYLIIAFSFLVMITRTSYWSISQFLIIILIPLIEKVARYRQLGIQKA